MRVDLFNLTEDQHNDFTQVSEVIYTSKGITIHHIFEDEECCDHLYFSEIDGLTIKENN